MTFRSGVPALCTVITFLVLAACGPEHNGDRGDAPPDTQSPMPLSDEQRSELFRRLHGSWIEKSLYDDLLRTGSPNASREYINDVIELFIDTTNVWGDTLEIGLNYSNHEGGSLYLLLSRQDTGGPYSLDYPGFEDTLFAGRLLVQVDGADSLLVFSRSDFEGQGIVKNSFVRSAWQHGRDPKVSGSALMKLINTIVIAGTYQLIDAGGGVIADTIRFNVDGSITGNKLFYSFFINADFVFPGISDKKGNFDEILLHYTDNGILTNQRYGLRRGSSGDTLELWDLEASKEFEDEQKVKRLRYRLIRVE